jgi:hypothetical protein
MSVHSQMQTLLLFQYCRPSYYDKFPAGDETLQTDLGGTRIHAVALQKFLDYDS